MRQDLSNKAMGFAELCEQYRASKESASSAPKAEDEEWAELYGVETDGTLDEITAESIPTTRESILTKVREMAAAVTSLRDKVAAQQRRPR